MAALYQVRGVGSRFVIFRNDVPVGSNSSRHMAEERAEALARRERAKPRGCITCGSRFMSEHAGHRMCDRCRKEPSGANYELAL